MYEVPRGHYGEGKSGSRDNSPKRRNQLFVITESWLRPALFFGGLLFFLILEAVNPYRPDTVSKKKRWINNLLLTLFNNIVIFVTVGSLFLVVSKYADSNNLGFLGMLDIPLTFKIVLGVIIMDFVLYIWHLLNHEVPFLWRFHRVHHSDINMDVSTATRFHTGELLISAGVKISAIYLIGIHPIALALFEIIIVLCAQFHHSSLKIPHWLDSLYHILFVPPSMHRIHHSVRIKERDSNYGTIFSFWDRVLGTLTRGIDQSGIKIGMGAYRKPGKLYLHQLLAMPFTRAAR